ncbi:MAG: CBS domain-containing protein [Steroidobacterales bacterium]
MVTAAQLLDNKPRVLYSIEAEEPVFAAIQLLAEHGIGALLVMRGTQLVGIVSERDYARKIILLGRSSSETPVWQIMSSPVLTARPAQSVRECMRVMTERRVRHLPVVEGERVLGILSIGDLVRAVLEEQQQTIEQLEHYIHN